MSWIVKQMPKIKLAQPVGLTVRFLICTGRGIGPCYTDKAARTGIRIADLMDPIEFTAALTRCGHLTEAEMAAEIVRYNRFRELLTPMVVDTGSLLYHTENILVEGGQGAMLDVDHGTYPYVTSSNTTIGSVCTGLGISFQKLKRVIGVVKAYTTRVGGGPFPSELLDDIGERISQKGKEFGTTTGRKRRCGWFDAPVVQYTTRLNGYTELAVLKLDILSGFDQIRILTHYRIDGVVVNDYPATINDLKRIEPVFTTMPGWFHTTHTHTN